jgi:hypothetical protein
MICFKRRLMYFYFKLNTGTCIGLYLHKTIFTIYVSTIRVVERPATVEFVPMYVSTI